MFDYQRKSAFPLSFYLTVLTLVVLLGGANLSAQTNTEAIRNAAITPEKLSASFAEVARGRTGGRQHRHEGQSAGRFGQGRQSR
jgi:hypothetical protein